MNARVIMRRLIIFAMCLFALPILRLGVYYIFYNSHFEPTTSQHRADILDSEGNVLATTIMTYSIYVIPHEILDKKIVAKQLSEIFELDEKMVHNKLSSRGKFIWIMRHISPSKAKLIARLDIFGVYIAKDSRRFYPAGGLFTTVIGRVDVDNNGITGIEKAYDHFLKTSSKPLILSLKSSMQFALKKVLDETKHTSRAKAVHGMIISAKDGRVLAMYSNQSSEDINPHLQYTENEKNLNIQNVYELGSVMKSVNAAMLLENDAVPDMQKKMFAPAVWFFGKHKITDSRRTTDCYYNFFEAFKNSSNVILGKLTYQIGLKKQIEFFVRCGFFSPMNIDALPVSPVISQKKWRAINGITAAYGYGIAVTTAHVVQALLRIISGRKMKLHILQCYVKSKDENLKIISTRTSRTMLTLLRGTMEGSYNEKKFNSQDYLIGGKTGTANKLKHVANRSGNQHNAYVASVNYCSYLFVYPANDPQVIGMITVDEPVPSKESFGYATAMFFAVPAGIKIVKLIVGELHSAVLR